jgi:prophage antirepressor-like protein
VGTVLIFVHIAKISSIMSNDSLTPMAFQFSATSQEVRSLIIDSDPWFVAKDVCDILNLEDTNKALLKLDDDEKLTRKIFGSGQNRKMWCVSESGLYALIMRSNQPEAKSFRKWVTSEVLPALRKQGHYGTRPTDSAYIDLRDVPYDRVNMGEHSIRRVLYQDIPYFSLIDLLTAIGAKTKPNQTAIRLNLKQTLAVKFWLFGDTNPAWFTTELGVRLINSGSRIQKKAPQLAIDFKKGGSHD